MLIKKTDVNFQRQPEEDPHIPIISIGESAEDNEQSK